METAEIRLEIAEPEILTEVDPQPDLPEHQQHNNHQLQKEVDQQEQKDQLIPRHHHKVMILADHLLVQVLEVHLHQGQQDPAATKLYK